MYHGPAGSRLAMQAARRTGAGASLAGARGNASSLPGWAHVGWEFVAVTTVLAALFALLRLLPALARRHDGDDDPSVAVAD